MLKKERDDIINEALSTRGMSAPYEAVGWSPGIEDYINMRVNSAVNSAVYAILNNIYTEKELEEKAENILLDNEEPYTKTESII